MDLHNNFIGREAGKLGIPIDESKLWTLPSTGTEYIIVTKSLFMKNKLFYSILLFYYMFRFHIKNKAEITIMNLSNQKVEMIEVVFPKQKFIFRDLDINSELKMDVPFASEGSIIVEAIQNVADTVNPLGGGVTKPNPISIVAKLIKKNFNAGKFTYGAGARNGSSFANSTDIGMCMSSL